jgi:SAM-dependent methyltransferase
MNIPDQKPMWDRKHAEGQHDFFSDEPSELAEKALGQLGLDSYILEIGSGNGRDARFYAAHGHRVIATDISEVAIEKCVANNSFDTIDFKVFDAREPLPYKDNTFDMVTSILALHYYTDEITRNIFSRIHRVLVPGGLLVFSCKSRDEKRMTGAEEVEPSLFVDKGGHVLHAFSKEYVRDILRDSFEIVSLEEKDAFYTNRVSAEVQCIARKI